LDGIAAGGINVAAATHNIRQGIDAGNCTSVGLLGYSRGVGLLLASTITVGATRGNNCHIWVG
jgi:hypothetical protein